MNAFFIIALKLFSITLYFVDLLSVVVAFIPFSRWFEWKLIAWKFICSNHFRRIISVNFVAMQNVTFSFMLQFTLLHYKIQNWRKKTAERMHTHTHRNWQEIEKYKEYQHWVHLLSEFKMKRVCFFYTENFSLAISRTSFKICVLLTLIAKCTLNL